MKSSIKWAARVAAGIGAVVVLAGAGALAASEVVIRRPWTANATPVAAAHDPGAVARGERLAGLYGCNNCHGADLSGRLFYDDMPVARLWAPNLTLVAAHQTDAQLTRAIRAGVAADGRSLWVMPSEAFAHLSNAETADILAYLRSRPATGARQPDKQLGVVGRIGALIGKFKPAPQLIAEAHKAGPIDLGPAFAEGRALSRACMECHGEDLKGGATAAAPDLSVAAAYDLEGFERLLRTGVAAGDRRLGLMSEIAPVRFNRLSDTEIAALHGYLTARSEVAP